MMEKATSHDQGSVDPGYRIAMGRIADLIIEAREAGVIEPTVAALATSGRRANPSVRMVDVVRVNVDGLVVFAHRMSGKGQQMQENPQVGLCFHWPVIAQQVTIEGSVAALPESEADEIWNSRPREVGLARWASDQTLESHSEQELKDRLANVRQEFNFERLPRPLHWSAFVLHPVRIEFWRTGYRSLRSRVRFQRSDAGIWIEDRLNP